MVRIPIKKLTIQEVKQFVLLFKGAPKKHTDDYDFYGAYDNEQLIGGIVIKPIPDLFHYKGLGLCPEVIVDFLFVLKEYRGKGIGRKLLNIALKYKSVGLRTGGMTTDAAKELYSKSGFKIVREKGFVKYWYWDKLSSK